MSKVFIGVDYDMGIWVDLMTIDSDSLDKKIMSVAHTHNTDMTGEKIDVLDSEDFDILLNEFSLIDLKSMISDMSDMDKDKKISFLAYVSELVGYYEAKHSIGSFNDRYAGIYEDELAYAKHIASQLDENITDIESFSESLFNPSYACNAKYIEHDKGIAVFSS